MHPGEVTSHERLKQSRHPKEAPAGTQPSTADSKHFWPRLQLTQCCLRGPRPPPSPQHRGNECQANVRTCILQGWMGRLSHPIQGLLLAFGPGLGMRLIAQAIGSSSGGAGGHHGKVRLHRLEKPVCCSEAARGSPSSGAGLRVNTQPCFKKLATEIAGSLGTEISQQKHRLLQNLSRVSRLRNAGCSHKCYKKSMES